MRKIVRQKNKERAAKRVAKLQKEQARAKRRELRAQA
ncbi:hypothetical protein MCFN_01230 [Mycoplasmopsis californica]|uniref:Uncharacterized protein n=1 Tax=Mycoplasmopsis californica TaxID=2113 RepID=A0A059XLJ1_9BACT|nr:hypothetical protein MCFN_01230 [Mycoplasmopsis californica]